MTNDDSRGTDSGAKNRSLNSRRDFLHNAAKAGGSLAALGVTGTAMTGVAAALTTQDKDEYTDLFHRTEGTYTGWLGADGVFSVSLNGDDSQRSADNSPTLLWFSDTFMGEWNNGTLESWGFANNSFAVFEQGGWPAQGFMHLYAPTDSSGNYQTAIVPDTPNAQPGEWYWLGDGFVNTAANDEVYIFAHRMEDTGSGVWGFAQTGVGLIKLTQEDVCNLVPSASCSTPGGGHHLFHNPPFQKDMDHLFIPGDSTTNEVKWGVGTFLNRADAGAPNPDGFLYIYGVEATTDGNGDPTKALHVARCGPAYVEFPSAFQYWTGSGWSSNNYDSQAIMTGVSDELSVSPLDDGRYAVVYQDGGVGDNVAISYVDNPWGPASSVSGTQQIWDCRADTSSESGVSITPDTFCYNAKAHPNLSQPGELLISYNVNDSNASVEHLVDDIYRPRWFSATDF